MLAFQNKCKRTSEELHKMVQKIDDREDHLNGSLGKDESSDDDGAQSPLDNTDDDECRSETVDALDGQVSAKETNVSKVKCSRPGRIACHICGKLYFPYEMKYHINKHNGKLKKATALPIMENNFQIRFFRIETFRMHRAQLYVKVYRSPVSQLSQETEPFNETSLVLWCLWKRYTYGLCQYEHNTKIASHSVGFKVKARLDMHRSYHFDPTLPCKICKKLFRNK